MIGQQPDEIPSLPAPCRQQRLTVIDTGQQRTVRIETGPMGMTARPGRQQRPLGHDVPPVVPARILHAHQHLAPAPQRRQHLQRLARHGRNAEDQHTARQPLRARPRRVGTGRHETFVHGSPVAVDVGHITIGQQRPPQRRLPQRFLRHGPHARWHALSHRLRMQILAGGHERRVPIGIQTGTRTGQARTPAFLRRHSQSRR